MFVFLFAIVIFSSCAPYCTWDMAEAQNCTQHSLRQIQSVIIKENSAWPWTGISSFGLKLQGMYMQNSTKPLLRAWKMWFSRAHGLDKMKCFINSCKNIPVEICFLADLCLVLSILVIAISKIHYFLYFVSSLHSHIGKQTNILSHLENMWKQINWQSQYYSGSVKTSK